MRQSIHRLWLPFAVLLVIAPANLPADIVYRLIPFSDFSAPGWGIDGGFIRTDGTLGEIDDVNILDYEINFHSNEHQLSFTPDNSDFGLVSNDAGGLFATTSTLQLITTPETTFVEQLVFIDPVSPFPQRLNYVASDPDSVGGIVITDLDSNPQFAEFVFPAGSDYTFAAVLDPIQVDSVEITEGIYVSGGIEDLVDSDDSDLVIRNFGAGSVQYEVKGISPYQDPSAYEITFEASTSPLLSNVTQVIEVFNYNTQTWQEVNQRRAERISDGVVSVSVTGDLSALVEPDTLCVEARIRFTSVNPRRRFSSSSDQFKWGVFR